MDINKKTANQIWNTYFGKETKTKDFAGRMIVKGAYGDWNSKFSWNIDHILPKKLGGKDNLNNLIPCHILTNQEKGQSFPSFKSNGEEFQIKKVMNHYEIHKNEHYKNIEELSKLNCNFYNSNEGLKFFYENEYAENTFSAIFLIKLKNPSYEVLYWINYFLEQNKLSFLYDDRNTAYIVRKYDIPKKNDISYLLNICILLNTYLKYFFIQYDHLDSYNIYYIVKNYNDESKKFSDDLYSEKNDCYWKRTENTIFVNELVYINSEEIKNNVSNHNFYYNKYLSYDYHFINLRKNLEKEIKILEQEKD
ncbi:MAG: HNH endonuclease [Metamycoplasmataceae bacterium]|uniref:HNH endonuclease n=1 Tax=Mycoplasmopsis lipophila TaxID=2117 RepID=UPI00387386D0